MLKNIDSPSPLSPFLDGHCSFQAKDLAAFKQHVSQGHRLAALVAALKSAGGAALKLPKAPLIPKSPDPLGRRD